MVRQFFFFVIVSTLFSLWSRRLVRYDCERFHERIPIVGRNGRHEKLRETREKGEICICIYRELEEQSFCIESRNANASNIDTASPFERSLNLSRHSSHPFPYSSTANPTHTRTEHTVVLGAHTRPPARIFPTFLDREDTRARRGRVGGVKGLPINRMCGL